MVGDQANLAEVYTKVLHQLEKIYIRPRQQNINL